MTAGKRLAAEFVGTFVLVLGGCGSAVLAAKVFTAGRAPGSDIQIGIGYWAWPWPSA